MAALSIYLPDSVAHESAIAAKNLGISGTEFIKQSIIHELEKP